MKKSYLLRGCMKLNDKREFQKGSLGERTSLLTSLFRWSFLARSLWLLIAAPMASTENGENSKLSKFGNFKLFELEIKFVQQ